MILFDIRIIFKRACMPSLQYIKFALNFALDCTIFIDSSMKIHLVIGYIYVMSKYIVKIHQSIFAQQIKRCFDQKRLVKEYIYIHGCLMKSL